MVEFTRCPKCNTLFDVADIDLSESNGWVQCGECTQQFDALQNSVRRSDLLGQSILASMADMTIPNSVQSLDDLGNSNGEFHVEQLAIEPATDFATPADFADYTQTEIIDLFEQAPPASSEQSDQRDTVNVDEAGDDYSDAGESPFHPVAVPFRPDDHYSNAEIVAHSVDEFRQRSLSVRSQVSESPSEDDSMVFGEQDLAVDKFHRELDAALEPASADASQSAVTDEESTLVVDDVYEELQSASKTPWARIIGLTMSVPLLAVLLAMLLFQLQQRQIITWIPAALEAKMTDRWFAFLDKGDAVKTDLAKIHLSSTRMEPHISKQSAVTVVLQLINRADFNQVYPDLEIAFTNDDGKVLSRRVVRPFEYLPSQQLNMLESQQARSLRLSFDQLPRGAVGYEIRITRRDS